MGDENDGVEKQRVNGSQGNASEPCDGAAAASPPEPFCHAPNPDCGLSKNPPPEGGFSIARDPLMPQTRAQWRAWLLAQRRTVSPGQRQHANQALLERLASLLGDCAGHCLALYWPVRGEPELGDWPGVWAQRGVRLALPVVEGPAQPLEFCEWVPGEPMLAGAFGIPQPVARRPVRPDILVVPCLGFDRQGWRLGYGGGFYDRTLAQLAGDGRGRPKAYGVAWDEAQCSGLQPLPTDWPLDAIVTPAALFWGLASGADRV